MRMVLVSHAVAELMNGWGFKLLMPTQAETLSFRVTRHGYEWMLCVSLHTTACPLTWSVSAEYREQNLVLFWTGGKVTSEPEWHSLRDELITGWLQRGLESEAAVLSELETDDENAPYEEPAIIFD